MITTAHAGQIHAPVNPNGQVFGLIPIGGGWLDDLIDWKSRQFHRADDAIRMAACWNACLGTVTADIVPHAAVQRIRQERDDALALLDVILEADDEAITALKCCGFKMEDLAAAALTERVRKFLARARSPAAPAITQMTNEAVEA